MPKRIERYQAGWNPNSNLGEIRLFLEDGSKTRLSFGSQNIDEQIVILQILQNADAPYLTPNGWISTEADEPGDA